MLSRLSAVSRIGSISDPHELRRRRLKLHFFVCNLYFVICNFPSGFHPIIPVAQRSGAKYEKEIQCPMIWKL